MTQSARPSSAGWWVAIIVVAVVAAVVGALVVVAFSRDEQPAAEQSALTVPEMSNAVPSSTTDPSDTAVDTTTTMVATTSTGGAATTSVALADFATLGELATDDLVVGYVGPYTVAGGSEVVVLARSGDDPLASGTVELALRRADGWHVERVLPAGAVTPPRPIDDLDGDGQVEVLVTMGGLSAGKTFDVVFRIDPNNPDLTELAFDLDTAQRDLGIAVIGLTIDEFTAGGVGTTVTTCEPSCAFDAGTRLDWTLDAADGLVFRPVVPPAEDPGLAASLPLSQGDTGSAVTELQSLLQQAGIWVGSSGVDGSFGGDTARAVAMLAAEGRFNVSIGNGDPGDLGVMTADRLVQLERLVDETPLSVDGDSPCPPMEEFLRSLGSLNGVVFQVSDVRCSSGWATANVSEYDFPDGLLVVFSVDGARADAIASGYGGDDPCSDVGVPAELRTSLDC